MLKQCFCSQSQFFDITFNFYRLTQLNSVKVWLAQQKVHYTTYLECHTKTLGVNGVVKLEKHISEFHSKEQKKVTTTVQVKPQSLFIPGTLMGLVPPDFKAEYKLLDRIVCVKNNFTVPLGLKGTIIGIQEKEEKCKDVYEILFDLPFTGITYDKNFCGKLVIIYRMLLNIELCLQGD